MGDEQKPNKKQPGEKQPGKFHYNPVNMSGKKAGIFKNRDEQKPKDSSDQNGDVDEGRNGR
jgi:hypothetical protein